MRFLTTIKKGFVIALAITAMAFGGIAAKADAISDMYAGKTLTILLGHPPGGSYDLYAQLAAAYMGKYIPGNPNIIVQHKPGGGGRKGAAFFLNNTQPDGMTVAILPDTLGHIELLNPEKAKWKANTFRYLGRFAPANAIFAVRKGAPATTIEDIRKTEIIVGCTGKSSRSAQQPSALRNVAKLKLRVICGYKGSKASKLATLRGETDMVSENWAALKANPGPMESGELSVILQAGLIRDPDLPDVPLLFEIVDDPEEKKVLRFISAGAPVGRSMMILPGTSEEVILALRKAFASMIADPAFLAEAEKRKAIIAPETGEYVEGIMKDIMSASPELIAAAAAAMDTTGNEALPKAK